MNHELLLALALFLCAAGCRPTANQVLAMRSWSSTARAACTHPGACSEPASCVKSVEVASRPDSTFAQYKAAEAKCWQYQTEPGQ